MGMSGDLKAYVGQVLNTPWQRTQGRVVPIPESIALGNSGVELDAVCLYADMADSTKLVNGYKDWFAATVYKCFLHCAVKILLNEGGAITSFDGDRVMAMFVGDGKESTAARAALKINWITKNVVEPDIKAHFAANLSSSFTVEHTCGIDATTIFATRSGVRGSNDIVWVGRSANYAAKLSAWRDPRYATLITEPVYAALSQDTKYSQGKNMWAQHLRGIDNVAVFSSTYTWPVS